MPDTSLLSPFVVKLGGGLMLDKDAFTLCRERQPSCKTSSRISTAAIVASTALPSSTRTSYHRLARLPKKVLGVHIYKDQVIAARGTKVFKGGATGSWTEIDTGRTSAGRYNFVNFNFNGTDKVVFVDGANPASVFDNTVSRT